MDTVRIIAAPGRAWTAKAEGYGTLPILTSVWIDIPEAPPIGKTVLRIGDEAHDLDFAERLGRRSSALRCNWYDAMSRAQFIAIASPPFSGWSWRHHGIWRVSDFVAPTVETAGSIVFHEQVAESLDAPYVPDPSPRYNVYVFEHEAVPIYVGKGLANRPLRHFRARTSNPPFYEYLVQHPGCRWRFLMENVDEETAFNVEREMIAKYRSEYGSSVLFNRT